MKEAIEKAIEGGWFPIEKGVLQEYYLFRDGYRYGFEANGRIELMSIADVTFNPLFWQALGKAMVWGKMMTSREGVRRRNTYLVYWHDFIDHLASGKDAESFFVDLLTHNK